MITKSFSIFEGISDRIEHKIKEQGIKDWNAFLKAEKVKGISSKRKIYYNSQILDLKESIRLDNLTILSKKVPLNKHWMFYEYYKDVALFLDIEVSGVKKEDYVFLIALYDGIDTKIMIKGINLDLRRLKTFVKNYPLIISFNGSVHDMPFLKKRYPDLFSDKIHIDLRFLANKAGLSGGLKEIERKLGIPRSKIQSTYRSGDIKRLWRMFKAGGDDYYLKLLLEYAEDDVISLKLIAQKLMNNINYKYSEGLYQ
jgi:uncharacterized protein